VVLAGKYKMQEETKDGLTIRVATYAFEPRNAPKLFALTRNIITYYQTFLGPFPFKEFNIIEKNSWGYGQAPPGVMLITKEAFNPFPDEMSRYFSKGINERFAHEIAHQYWGHVVKMPSFEEQWLTESFAEYCAGLFIRYVKGAPTYNLLVDGWRTHAERAAAASAIPTANELWSGSNTLEQMRFRFGLIYEKGAYLLYCLNQELGDKVFQTFLKSYQATFRWKFGTTEHLNGLLTHLTGKDREAFFDRYYWGPELPPKPSK
jgi:aminopeptidase N